MDFDPQYLVRHLPALWRGLMVTIEVSLAAMLLSIVLGVLGAAARYLKLPVLWQFVAFYVEFIRNTPLLVQMFFIVFGLPAIGLTLSLFWSGVVSLAIWAAAYHVESIRGGLETVNKGLREAGQALGLKPWQFLVKISLPLAMRVAIPSMLNTSVSLVKNSSMLQAIGLMELTFVAVDRMAIDFRMLEMFTVLVVVYLALVFILSFAAGRIEAVLQKPFRA
jgi:His/Glu/Gln/Arg/opine family amino acid ABC transporter permease subunit